MKIYTPVKDFNGVHASVRFVNGVGETNDPHLIEWFRSHGYELEDSNLVIEDSNLVIEEQNDEIETVVTTDDEDELMGYADREPDFEKMTPNELRDWARANGFGNKIKNTRNKEKLIEILRG